MPGSLKDKKNKRLFLLEAAFFYFEILYFSKLSLKMLYRKVVPKNLNS